jgi:hypothetical protein
MRTNVKTEGKTPKGAPFAIIAHWDGGKHVASSLNFEPFDGVGSFSLPAKTSRNGDLYHAVRMGEPYSQFLRC